VTALSVLVIRVLAVASPMAAPSRAEQPTFVVEAEAGIEAAAGVRIGDGSDDGSVVVFRPITARWLLRFLKPLAVGVQFGYSFVPDSDRIPTTHLVTPAAVVSWFIGGDSGGGFSLSASGGYHVGKTQNADLWPANKRWLDARGPTAALWGTIRSKPHAGFPWLLSVGIDATTVTSSEMADTQSFRTYMWLGAFVAVGCWWES